MNQGIYKIHPKEIKQVAGMLQQAFEHDPMFQWLFNNDLEFYYKVSKQAFAAWVNYCVRYGLAIRTANFDAISICRQPGDVTFNRWKLFWSGMSAIDKILCPESLRRYQLLTNVFQQAKNSMQGQHFWHGWMIATNPNCRCQGFANELGMLILTMADQQQLPIYLEAHACEQLYRFYRKYDFEILQEIVIPGADFTMNALVRWPNQS